MKIPIESTGAAAVPKGGPHMNDYYHENQCTWCDGCGDYGIWTATKRALVELKLHPHEVLLCFDVGCHGNGSDKLKGYRFHGLHGRVIPFAAAAKLANMNVPVIAFGGDGASFSEGIGHFVHAVRSNYPITFVLHNNANYGLTTGQASSLTWKGQQMNTSPYGIPERTLQSMDLVFSLEPSFVARGFSGDIDQLTAILVAAIKHQKHGFAFVDALQACPTYNKFATHEYLLEHCKEVQGESDVQQARRLAVDSSEHISTGVLYQRTDIPTFADELEGRKGRTTQCTEEVAITDVRSFL